MGHTALTGQTASIIFPPPDGGPSGRGSQKKDGRVVSSTKQTTRRRRLRAAQRGRWNKRDGTVLSPTFPVHPEGYDPKAPDAKKAQS